MKAFRIENERDGCGLFSSNSVYSVVRRRFHSIIDRHNTEMPAPGHNSDYLDLIMSDLVPIQHIKFAFISMELMLYFLNANRELLPLLDHFSSLRLYEFEIDENHNRPLPIILDETQIAYDDRTVHYMTDITAKIKEICQQSTPLKYQLQSL